MFFFFFFQMQFPPAVQIPTSWVEELHVLKDLPCTVSIAEKGNALRVSQITLMSQIHHALLRPHPPQVRGVVKYMVYVYMHGMSLGFGF